MILLDACAQWPSPLLIATRLCPMPYAPRQKVCSHVVMGRPQESRDRDSPIATLESVPCVAVIGKVHGTAPMGRSMLTVSSSSAELSALEFPVLETGQLCPTEAHTHTSACVCGRTCHQIPWDPYSLHSDIHDAMGVSLSNGGHQILSIGCIHGGFHPACIGELGLLRVQRWLGIPGCWSRPPVRGGVRVPLLRGGGSRGVEGAHVPAI